MPMNKLQPGTTARYMAHRHYPNGDTQTVVFDSLPEEALLIAHEEADGADRVTYACLGEGDPTVPTANPATFVHTVEQAARYNLGYTATELTEDLCTGPEDFALLGMMDREAERAGVDPAQCQAHIVEELTDPALAALKHTFGDRMVVLDTPEAVDAFFSGLASSKPPLH